MFVLTILCDYMITIYKHIVTYYYDHCYWSKIMVIRIQTAASNNSAPTGRPSCGGMLVGQPLCSCWYWCVDQTMVQRVLSAKGCGNPWAVGKWAVVSQGKPSMVRVCKSHDKLSGQFPQKLGGIRVSLILRQNQICGMRIETGWNRREQEGTGWKDL